MIKIMFNGSKMSGQAPDDLETLFALMKVEPLDPIFEHYGCFADAAGVEQIRRHGMQAPAIQFHGNFLHVSHAFSILVDDGPTIERFVAAIKENRESDAYRSERTAVLAACHCRECRPSSVRVRTGR